MDERAHSTSEVLGLVGRTNRAWQERALAQIALEVVSALEEGTHPPINEEEAIIKASLNGTN